MINLFSFLPLKKWGTFFSLVAITTLVGCGFQLRGLQGQMSLPIEQIYVETNYSAIGDQLKRIIKSSGPNAIVNDPAEARAIVTIVAEAREKRILSLTQAGRVREYKLIYRAAFRVNEPNGKDIMSTQNVELFRDLPFTDTELLAKESEEALLYRDMQTEAVQQIIRRIGAHYANRDIEKPAPK